MRSRSRLAAALALCAATPSCYFSNIQNDVDRTPTMDAGAGASILMPGESAPMVVPGTAAGIVELRCETAPVANGDDFKQLASDLARQVAEGSGAAGVEALLAQKFVGEPSQTLQDRLLDVQNRIRENMVVSRFQKFEGPAGSYEHHNGRVGVLLEVNCETDFVAKTDDFQALVRDVAMHIAAASPAAAVYVTKEEVPVDVLEKEKEIYREQARAAGKPDKVLDKIAEGKLKDFYSTFCLLEQPFVKEPKLSVGQLVDQKSGTLGDTLAVREFARFRVGEGGDEAEAAAE